MSVYDAEPTDIYIDAQGKLWRCLTICKEPTVTFESVEGHTIPPYNSQLANMAAQANCYNSSPPAPPIIKDKQSGGVHGLMWSGWKRIYRNEKTSK